MSLWMQILVIAALSGSALMAGLFFAFSTFIMKAFRKIPVEAGMDAMRSINRVIINPWFVCLFLGTTVVSLVLTILVLVGSLEQGGFCFLAAACLYLSGTFLITGIRNIPLNNQLATVADSDAKAFWQHYLKKWTRYNHIRTLSSFLAVILYAIGLMQF